MFAAYRFPLPPLTELRREVERLFDEFRPNGSPWPHRAAGVYPALNVWDAGSELRIEAELPGVRQEDLEIFAMGNEVTIKGRRGPLDGEGHTYHRQERGTGEFSRVITLPVDVDADKVEAALKDGVLNVRLPKAENAKPRKVAVKTK